MSEWACIVWPTTGPRMISNSLPAFVMPMRILLQNQSSTWQPQGHIVGFGSRHVQNLALHVHHVGTLVSQLRTVRFICPMTSNPTVPLEPIYVRANIPTKCYPRRGMSMLRLSPDILSNQVQPAMWMHP
jgi:hypothetical protein